MVLENFNQNPQELKLFDSCGFLNFILRISNFVP